MVSGPEWWFVCSSSTLVPLTTVFSVHFTIAFKEKGVSSSYLQIVTWTWGAESASQGPAFCKVRKVFVLVSFTMLWGSITTALLGLGSHCSSLYGNVWLQRDSVWQANCQLKFPNRFHETVRLELNDRVCVFKITVIFVGYYIIYSYFRRVSIW